MARPVESRILAFMFNLAVWKRTFAESRGQLLASCLLLLLFGWFFVWLQSLFQVGALAAILGFLPDFVQELLGVPLEQLVTPLGRLSFLYVHLVSMLVCIGWAIARGSAAVSGGISRGTYELILTLPIWRVSVLLAVAGVTALGSVLLALSLWLGNCLGIATVEIEGQVRSADFLPGAVNLCLMTFCFSGITALFSSFDRDRWRTMWLASGFFVVSLILDMVARLWQPGGWLAYLSFLSAYDPQKIILAGPGAWAETARCSGILLGVGLGAYGLAGVVFARRDIPVPH